MISRRFYLFHYNADYYSSFNCSQVTRADAKDIVFDNISRKRMQDGINKIADAVAVTLGPRGKFFKLLLPFSYTSFYLLCIQHANSKYIVSILLQFI